MCSILNSYKIVRKNITNIIILASLLFTGCSLAVPEPDEANQTLLIIPVESRQTLHKFVWVLHVSIEDSSSNEKHNHIIEPNPKSFFSYSRGKEYVADSLAMEYLQKANRNPAKN